MGSRDGRQHLILLLQPFFLEHIITNSRDHFDRSLRLFAPVLAIVAVLVWALWNGYAAQIAGRGGASEATDLRIIRSDGTAEVLGTENVPKRASARDFPSAAELEFGQRTIRHSLSEIAATRPRYKPPSDSIYPSDRWEALGPLRSILGFPKTRGRWSVKDREGVSSTGRRRGHCGFFRFSGRAFLSVRRRSKRSVV